MRSSNERPPTTVAIIGVGAHGQLRAEAYAALPNAPLVAVADVQEERARHVAATFGVPRSYTNFRELSGEITPDIVSICMPDPYHFEPTMAALQAGCHVFLEKPMALHVNEAEQMVEEAERRGRKMLVGFGPR